MVQVCNLWSVGFAGLLFRLFSYGFMVHNSGFGRLEISGLRDTRSTLSPSYLVKMGLVSADDGIPASRSLQCEVEFLGFRSSKAFRTIPWR